MPRDSVDSASREEIRQLQLERLQTTLNRAYFKVDFYRKRMDSLQLLPEDVASFADLRRFPFTTREDLEEHYPYGLFAVPLRSIVRLKTTARALRAGQGKPVVVGFTKHDVAMWQSLMVKLYERTGVTDRDIVQVAFNFSLFPGAFTFNHAAEAIGATLAPSATISATLQLQIMQDFRSTVLATTAAFALHIVETMERDGITPASLHLRHILLGPEPLSEVTRERLESAFGIPVYGLYGVTEMVEPGMAGECPAKDGLHFAEDQFLAEIIHPVTGEVLGPGHEGELVLTTLTAEADHHSQGPEAIEGLHEGGLPDGVVDHVDALSSGDFPNPGDEILFTVEDGIVAPVASGKFRLGLGTRRADYRRAKVLGPLADDGPYAARGRMDQDGIPLLYRKTAVQQVSGGHPLQHHRGGLLEGNAVGEFHQALGGNAPDLGVGSHHSRIGNSIPRGHFGHTVAGCDHHPGALHPDDRGHGRKWIQAGPVIDIDEIEARGLMANHCFAGTGPAGIEILPLQNLRSARLVHDDGLAHGVILPRACVKEKTGAPRRGSIPGRRLFAGCVTRFDNPGTKVGHSPPLSRRTMWFENGHENSCRERTILCNKSGPVDDYGVEGVCNGRGVQRNEIVVTLLFTPTNPIVGQSAGRLS